MICIIFHKAPYTSPCFSVLKPYNKHLQHNRDEVSKCILCIAPPLQPLEQWFCNAITLFHDKFQDNYCQTSNCCCKQCLQLSLLFVIEKIVCAVKEYTFMCRCIHPLDIGTAFRVHIFLLNVSDQCQVEMIA